MKTHKHYGERIFTNKANTRSKRRLRRSYELDTGVGDKLDDNKGQGVMRLVLQNPRGLGQDKGNIIKVKTLSRRIKLASIAYDITRIIPGLTTVT